MASRPRPGSSKKSPGPRGKRPCGAAQLPPTSCPFRQAIQTALSGPPSDGLEEAVALTPLSEALLDPAHEARVLGAALRFALGQEERFTRNVVERSDYQPFLPSGLPLPPPP
jgi:hypothetical protein